jgi:hypothetical protein
MEQNPKLTLDWALHSLELALRNLEDGPAERRVRRQFHQLLLAIERDAWRRSIRRSASASGRGAGASPLAVQEDERVLVVRT